MLLNQRKDGFRFLLPSEFIPEEICAKYSRILNKNREFFNTPIDFLNETIQNVQVLGIQDAIVIQQQTGRGNHTREEKRMPQNRFLHTASEHAYRSETNPLNLLDKTLNVGFRHTLGYLNYFILFESFWWQYSRDEQYDKMPKQFNIELINNRGEIYAKLVLFDPVIQSIDMLDLDFTQPISTSETFKVVFKYSNFDLQLIEYDDNEEPEKIL